MEAAQGIYLLVSVQIADVELKYLLGYAFRWPMLMCGYTNKTIEQETGEMINIIYKKRGVLNEIANQCRK